MEEHPHRCRDQLHVGLSGTSDRGLGRVLTNRFFEGSVSPEPRPEDVNHTSIGQRAGNVFMT
jgi:hypothetical protein